MRSRLRIRHAGWLAALALAAWGAAPASAEPLATLGQGVAPSAVTDAAGTLHVVWRQFGCPGTSSTAACPPAPRRAPRSQIASSRRHALPAAASAGRRPGRRVPVARRHAGRRHELRRLRRRRHDLDGQRRIGVGMEAISDAKLTPDGGLVDTVRSKRQGGPLPARAAGRRHRAAPRVAGHLPDPRLPRLTHLPDGRPAVIAQYVAGRLGTRVAVPSADVGVPGSWSPFGAWRSLAAADASAADAGPTGTWLLTTTPHRTSAGTLPVRIWRWGTHGFERPQSIGALARGPGQSVGGAQDTNKLALDVDLAGRLHAAWPLGARPAADSSASSTGAPTAAASARRSSTRSAPRSATS